MPSFAFAFFLVSFVWLDATASSLLLRSGLVSGAFLKQRGFNLFGLLSCFDLLVGFALCWELTKGAVFGFFAAPSEHHLILPSARNDRPSRCIVEAATDCFNPSAYYMIRQ
jgi:hypothetical protein